MGVIRRVGNGSISSGQVQGLLAYLGIHLDVLGVTSVVTSKHAG